MARHPLQPRLPVQPTRRLAGFTLIEALVSIVVMSIGVLALARLQAQTLVDGRSASMRNIATMLAYNLADQVRSNEAAQAAGYYNLPGATPTAACYSTAGCTPQQMAVTSYKVWLDEAGSALPGGYGTVCIDSTPGDGTPSNPQCDNAPNAPYAIKIWWQDDLTHSGTASTTAPPQCPSL
ncbi:type IV pilus modification protein PilV [Cupriavidus sp. D39]|uniref:type IV pilus modification protein PilV n=1 Tax=Cupriavidus sp. D39 TaxID=2997877 RepID=UPI00226E2DF5|nr:type IV pilus modification protein PilV [Cupriavidus sp. D39]MCY0856150.1 type IV pilus modification protein PilV [Cupriavidus sp. D39]